MAGGRTGLSLPTPLKRGSAHRANNPRLRDRRSTPRPRPSPAMLPTAPPPLAEALTGSVVLPGDPGWDDARSAFNLLLDQHPAAVAFPADAQDAAARGPYPGQAGLRVPPQATAHNQGPPDGLENTLLLNVGALQELWLDPGAQRVRVGAG